MTYDVIAGVRARTRRLLRITALVLLCALALVYPAGLWVNAHLADGTPSASIPPVTGTALSTPGSLMPADLAWVEVAGVALPVSRTAGPRNTNAGLARGFAHDPAGAVLAAVHLLVRTTAQVGPSVFEPTFTTQVVGPDAAVMLEMIRGDYGLLVDQAQVPYGQPVGRLDARLVAFRVDSFTSQTAKVSVVTEAADHTGATHLAATGVTLTWTDNDWALQAPPAGSWNSAVVLITAEQASAYTPIPIPPATSGSG